MSTFWNLVNIFGITMRNAVKQVQTCLVLLQTCVKCRYFCETKRLCLDGETHGRVQSIKRFAVKEDFAFHFSASHTSRYYITNIDLENIIISVNDSHTQKSRRLIIANCILPLTLCKLCSPFSLQFGVILKYPLITNLVQALLLHSKSQYVYTNHYGCCIFRHVPLK